MIYCVIPEALEAELYDKLTRYYAQDDNVSVIIERRQSERRGGPSNDGAAGQQREVRDRRRARVPGEFPALEGAVSERAGGE